MYLGICVPDSCSKTTIDYFLEKIIKEKKTEANSLYNLLSGNGKEIYKKISNILVRSNLSIIDTCQSNENQSKLSTADWVTM